MIGFRSQCYLRILAGLLFSAMLVPMAQSAQNHPPQGFTAVFNGKNLEGWWGLGTEHYNTYRNLTPEQLRQRQEASREDIRKHWRVEKGELVNDGNGLYLTTDKFYDDIELLVDYRTVPKADSGIYLRGIPQVQIWDYTKAGGKWDLGADKGSGGLWNNPPGSAGKDPLALADKPFGKWNSLRIRMIGPYVTVTLNGKLVVKDAILHNYFDKENPIPANGPIQLQTHGGEIRWRNVFVREIPAEEANTYLDNLDDQGFQTLFNGTDFTGWAGPIDNYEVTPDRTIRCKPSKGGTIYSKDPLTDFVAKLEIKIPPGGNNGLAIRYPGKGDTAYVGMCELQVLDDGDAKYATLNPRQYHGSVYAMFAAKRGYQRPVGQWNFEKVTVKGYRITVELNGTVITDVDVSKLDPATFMYPAEKFVGRLRTEGFFGFAGHSDPVQYRNIRIKQLR